MPEDAPVLEEEQDTGQSEADGPDQPDTPSEEPQGSEPAQTDNWEQRYQSLQPEYTRATQELAQFRQLISLAQRGDPDAIDALGLPTDEDEYDDEDADEPLTKREWMDYMRSQQQATQEEMAREQALDFAASEMEKTVLALEQQRGSEFTDEELDILIPLAERHLDDRGVPDAKAAYEMLDGFSRQRFQEYSKSKKSPRVEVGQAGSEKINFANEEERQNYMAAVMEAEMEASS